MTTSWADGIAAAVRDAVSSLDGIVELQPHQRISADFDGGHLLLAGRGAGKLLALGTPVPTPTGWSTMGELSPGDHVLDMHGSPTTVVEVSPVQTDTTYRMVLDDGSEFITGASHQWVTTTNRDRKQAYRNNRIPEVSVRTSQDIVNTLRTNTARPDLNHAIPVTGELTLPEASDLPIPPYDLGVWLGDGSRNTSRVTLNDQDAEDIITQLTEPVRLVHPERGCSSYALGSTGDQDSLVSRLKRLGIERTKEIPPQYLRASAEQRMALLRGLMDTDGYCGGNTVEFTSTDQVLAHGAHELAVSLGFKATIRSGRASLNGEDHGPKWRVCWRPDRQVFGVSRKAKSWTPPGGQATRSRQRMIVSMERVSPVPMRCITVDSPTSTYLVGRNMVPTHNTMAAMHWLNHRALEEAGLRARVIAPTAGDGVASCVEGVDGLLALSGNRATFHPAAPGGAHVAYPNGSKVWIVGTPTPKDVDRLRALTNIEIDVFEEAAANPQIKAAVQQAALSRRRGKPRWVATTTPRPIETVKKWLKDAKVTVVRARMSDNPHLPEAYREYAESLKGTRLYQQEVLGEVIEDVEGALWTFNDIERSYVDDLPEFDRVEVGVDPAVGSGTTGIIVAGIAEGVTYIIDDLSMTDAAPSAWARKVAAAVEEYDASCVVVEDNQGGRLVEETLQSADLTLPIQRVNSRVSKEARATPVAVLWEVTDQRARMARGMVQLVEQMLEWVPGVFSPDRIDAMVHVTAHLRGKSHGVVEIHSAAREKVTTLAGFRQMRAAR